MKTRWAITGSWEPLVLVFMLRLKIGTRTKKNMCAYFSKCSTRIVPCYLCPVPKYVFSVFNFRTNFKNVVYLYPTLLQFNWFVSVVSSLNQRSSVRNRKLVVRITCVLMFDVLSNEKYRNSRRGFDLLTLTHCWHIFYLKINMEMKVPMWVNRQTVRKTNSDITCYQYYKNCP